HRRSPRRRPGCTPGRQPNRRARKGVDNGRASYGAIESARRPPVTHPHSTRAPKGTFLLCATRGHSYCALTPPERSPAAEVPASFEIDLREAKQSGARWRRRPFPTVVNLLLTRLVNYRQVKAKQITRRS